MALLAIATATGVLAQTQDSALVAEGDSLRPVHRLEAEVIDGAVLHTNRFLEGYNPEVRTMNQYFTVKAKYAFMPSPDSEQAHIYKGVYQGAGLSYHHLNPQIGNPFSAYLFQGATIATLSRRLSLNYEWDFGLTYGWKSNGGGKRPDNRVIGSKMTAYMDVDFYLRWMLSRQWDLNLGWTVSHFSNANTTLPNAGLNTTALKLSVAYYLNRPAEEVEAGPRPAFQRHWSTDLVVFGAWKRKGFENAFGAYTLPGTFGVIGANVNPMYNVSHWFNVGASLDMYYDHSANLSLDDAQPAPTEGEDDAQQGDIPELTIEKIDLRDRIIYPAWHRQVTAGLSVRGEFVMPYFAINFGIGHNFINAGSSPFKGFYEVLALKVAVSQKLFLHIGYSLYDFQYPNNLMLGVGYRLGSHRKWF
ncbi:MAG: acyloxyacyl hydrolase [Prevotella sp.]|nr:acyloxyacyl hydrolase [Prevotella sp.]